MKTAALIAVLSALALGAAGCGDDTETEAPSAQNTPEQTVEAGPATPEELAAQISEDTESKPEIPAPSAEPPADLQTIDIVEGKGKKAGKGDELSMQYVGASWSTGAQFDASWDRGAEPFTFQLGAGMVIPGWDEGIAGMKEGGRRLLVIPSEMGYGPSGTPDGSIAPNETLIFVVDLEKVA